MGKIPDKASPGLIKRKRQQQEGKLGDYIKGVIDGLERFYYLLI